MGKSCTRFVRPIAGMQLPKVVEQTKDGRTVFVKFASQFCGACQESKAAISEALGQTCAEVMELDADVAGNVADAHKVENLPTVIAFRNGKAVARLDGAETPAKYKAFFEKHQGK
jgi:thioredoxin-like negative regulator of GroEL